MSGIERLEGNLTSIVERKDIDSDEEVTLMVERFRRFMKSHKKRMTSKVKEEKKITLSKKRMEAMIATWSDNEVEVVEGCSTSSIECAYNYFTFPVSYQEEAQTVTKCLSLEEFKKGNLKSGDQRGASLREASIDDMTHESITGRSFDQGSTCSGNSSDSVVDYQEFIDFLRKCLKKKKDEVFRLHEDNLHLRAKVTHLDEEVSLIQVNEVMMEKELEEARNTLAKMTSGSDMDDSLKTDVIDVSEYEKEIEDCHQRMKAMKDELANKENSLKLVKEREMRCLEELKKAKVKQPQAQGKSKASSKQPSTQGKSTQALASQPKPRQSKKKGQVLEKSITSSNKPTIKK